MGKAPAFLLYAADFYMDTNTWTIDEIGVYTRLLMSEWVNGPLPHEESRLARAAGCTLHRFKNSWGQVKIKFKENEDGFLFNCRLEEVRAEQKVYQEKQSIKGQKSAEKRWGNRVTVVKPQLQPEDKPEGSSSSSSSNIPPIAPRKRGTEYSDQFMSFYGAYPKKVGRDAAWRAWQKRIGEMPSLDELLTTLSRQKKSVEWTKDNKKYIPNPATWINQGRWADELTKQQNEWS